MYITLLSRQKTKSHQTMTKQGRIWKDFKVSSLK
jgi:hypothetical protein